MVIVKEVSVPSDGFYFEYDVGGVIVTTMHIMNKSYPNSGEF